MLINFSNHPCNRWSEKQKKAAEKYGETVDLAFPAVPGMADESQIEALASDSIDLILKKIDDDPKSAVMVQGEFTLTYAVVSRLQKFGVRTISACSERHIRTEEDQNGNIIKTVVFDFERFREYREFDEQGSI